MKRLLSPHLLLVTALAGWLNREQEKLIDYLHEENRVLRELLGERALRLTNDQRRRLAAKGCIGRFGYRVSLRDLASRAGRGFGSRGSL